MNTEIFYFSGTGNSLFAAREIAKQIPESRLTPIIKLLNQKTVTSKAEVMGIVFPIHLTTIPLPVEKFLSLFDFSTVKYIFILATRMGTTHRVFTDINKILQKKNRFTDACFTLNMGNNDAKFKISRQPVTDEKIKKLETDARKKLETIIEIIKNKKQCQKPDTEVIQKIPLFFLGIIPFLLKITERFNLSETFYADDKCITCRNCERICLSGKITMAEQKPSWQKNISCYRCYACLNYCPQQAVQIKNTYTKNNGRYPHPYAEASDIAAQK